MGEEVVHQGEVVSRGRGVEDGDLRDRGKPRGARGARAGVAARGDDCVGAAGEEVDCGGGLVVADGCVEGCPFRGGGGQGGGGRPAEAEVDAQRVEVRPTGVEQPAEDVDAAVLGGEVHRAGAGGEGAVPAWGGVGDAVEVGALAVEVREGAGAVVGAGPGEGGRALLLDVVLVEGRVDGLVEAPAGLCQGVEVGGGEVGDDGQDELGWEGAEGGGGF